MTARPPTILEAIDDPRIFARPWFKHPTSWVAWRAFLAVLFGLPLAPDQLAIFKACTGLAEPPPATNEAWLVCGRRSGKSFMLAVIAVYLATFRDWRQYLTPGERGVINIVSPDRRQSRILLRYCHALLKQVEALSALVEQETADEISLSSQVTIAVQTCNFRSIRGTTTIAALLDELAFWKGDESSSNPDIEVLNALRPAMATIPGAFLLGASSPYAKRGVLYDQYRRHWAQPTGPLVWHAPTATMNPTVPGRILDEAFERDPVSAEAEYGAQFRSDIATFLDRSLLDAATDTGVVVRPPNPSAFQYVAFADPSGGSSDSFALAVAHNDGAANAVVLDCLFERRPPFNPSAVVAEIKALLASYRLTVCTGDRYGAQWVVEAFKKEGLTYWHSQRDRSALYQDALPLFTSGRVRLIADPRLVEQLARLERRSGSGRDRIDHPPHAHDDLANATAGALVAASKASAAYKVAQPILIGGGPVVYFPGLQNAPVRAPLSGDGFPPAVRTGKRFDRDFGRDW
jgi:hypothetical protein